MAEKFDEFLEEVEQDIRHEKMQNLWKKYGKYIVGGVTGIFLLLGGYNMWTYFDSNKRIQMAEKFSAAQDYMAAGNMEKALAVLNSLSTESNQTYQPLALFEKAGILLKAKPDPKISEAIAIYEELAANNHVDPLWRNFASLLSCMIRLDQPNTNVDEILKQIAPLAEDQSPWNYLAKEMKGIALYKKGETAEAARIFANLVQDNQTPTGISMRARLMVDVLSSEIN